MLWYLKTIEKNFFPKFFVLKYHPNIHLSGLSLPMKKTNKNTQPNVKFTINNSFKISNRTYLIICSMIQYYIMLLSMIFDVGDMFVYQVNQVFVVCVVWSLL